MKTRLRKRPKPPLLLDIGHAMKKLRQKKNMSQGDIVRATGLERAYVSRLESNKIPYPRIGTVLKITGALGVSVDEFVLTSLKGSATVAFCKDDRKHHKD